MSGVTKHIYEHEIRDIVSKEDIENDIFKIEPFLDKWYLDSSYKELALLKGSKVTS